jgi:hypothetical protein
VRVLVISLVSGLFVVTGITWAIEQPSVQAQMSQWKLVPEPEHFTELFLNSYDTLPVQVTPGKRVPFSFSIHNREGKTTTYAYSVYVLTAGGTRIAIADSAVSLADDYAVTISKSYTFGTSVKPVTVYVELPDVGEKLHFTLPRTPTP